MPYIPPPNRERLDPQLDTLALKIDTPGELNYAMTRLAHSYIGKKGLSYQFLNEVQGVFRCASDEFARRVVAPYEDEKIQENGDIFIYDVRNVREPQPTPGLTALPVALPTEFAVGDEVEWTSQAGGRTKAKQGRIALVIPPNKTPRDVWTAGWARNFCWSWFGNGRGSVSYLVAVRAGSGKPKLYWPLVHNLKKVSS